MDHGREMAWLSDRERERGGKGRGRGED